ncbi:MAG: hypothetical protein CMH49_10370 [Myxococcales bacterium]|nr:hypothetical protein [Myxococcales bacterium]
MSSLIVKLESSTTDQVRQKYGVFSYQTFGTYFSRVFRLILISWLVISIPCLSLAAPLPRVFVLSPNSDTQTQSVQIGKRLVSSLKEYLKKSKRLKLEDGKVNRRQSKDAKLMEAESLKVSSIDLFKEGKFEEARAGFVSSLRGFQKSVASIRDMKSVYQTLYYAAAACLALEYDDDAKDYLRQLAAIAPEGDFETQVSAKVKKKYKRERKRLLRKKKGALTIETTPPGAKVWVNGEERCTSPCEVKDLTRGKHYIWTEKSGIGKAGSVTKVKAGWSTPLKFNLVKPKKSKSNELVPKELLSKIEASLSKAKVDGQLKEYLDQIAEDQEVGYITFMYILSKKRNVQLFSFMYDFNEKKAVAIKPFKFRANFSATRITAMKMVKEIERLVKVFPEDKYVDGVHQPLLAAIKQQESAAKVAVIVPPVVPPVPKVTPVPPVSPKLPKAKVVTQPKAEPKAPLAAAPKKDLKPKITQKPSKPLLSSKTTKDFKAPPKNNRLLAPPPKTSKEDNKKGGILASPWFWTGVSVVLVAGATTGAVLLLDSADENQNFQSRVEW